MNENGIWCQNGIPFLAPYSAKTEPVLAPYGAKDGISFWHYMVLKTELRFGTIWYFLGYSYIQFLIIFWAIFYLI